MLKICFCIRIYISLSFSEILRRLLLMVAKAIVLPLVIANFIPVIRSTYESKSLLLQTPNSKLTSAEKPNSKDNSNIGFRTTVQAFAPGYISTSTASSSSSSSSTLIMTDNSHQEYIINNNASSNLTQNILKNVQNKLEQNGIDFSLEN